MISKTFCADPWNTVFIGIDNTVKNCCAAREPLGDLTKNTIAEILGGDKAKEIKHAILNNEWHASCSQCQNLESAGTRSYRNQTCSKELAAAISQDVDYFNLKKLDVRWNNTCNLACNYCGEHFSSTWGKINGSKPITVRAHYPNTLSWVEQNKSSVEQLLVLGGEPLITKETNQLIEIFADQPVIITVVTSLSLDLEKSTAWQNLLRFKHVDLHISFENTGDRYNYVRHNASWHQLTQNIEKVLALPNVTIKIDPIYNIYNATDLVNFYRFVHHYDFQLTWIQVHTPMALDVTLFEPSVKRLAIEEIDRVLEEFKDYEKGDLDFIKNMRSILLSEHTSNAKNFMEFTGNLENNLMPNKKHSFFELWPEFEFIKSVSCNQPD